MTLENVTNKENEMIKNIFHLSHTDLDGYGCQILTGRFVNEYPNSFNIEFYNSNYGDEILVKVNSILRAINKLDKEEIKNSLLLITDLNLTEDIAKYLDLIQKDLGFKLILLDHHKSGASVAEQYDWYDLTEGKSGTRLTYEFIKSDFLLEGLDPRIKTDIIDNFEYGVECVDTYDLWKKENEAEFAFGSNLSFYLHMIGNMFNRGEMENLHDSLVRRYLSYNMLFLGINYRTYGVESKDSINKICKTMHSSLDFIIDVAKNNSEDTKLSDETLAGAVSKLKIMHYVDMYKQNFLNISLIDKLDNKVLAIYTRNSISSLILNGIIEEFNKEYGTVAIMSCNSSGIVSCRSIGEFDVSEFAKAQGGGGHKNASGFQIDIKALNEIAKEKTTGNEVDREIVLIGSVIGDLTTRALDFYSTNKE